MGAYINPENETKEIFLAREGKPINLEQAREHNDFKDKLLVIVVQNPGFSAAAIAFSEREKNDFLEPNDNRLKLYFLVEIKKLWAVCNELSNYLKVNP